MSTTFSYNCLFENTQQYFIYIKVSINYIFFEQPKFFDSIGISFEWSRHWIYHLVFPKFVQKYTAVDFRFSTLLCIIEIRSIILCDQIKLSLNGIHLLKNLIQTKNLNLLQLEDFITNCQEQFSFRKFISILILFITFFFYYYLNKTRTELTKLTIKL